jgi:glucosamine--fructose-6-phosphate aminotransferase (isomerizing)
MCGIIGITGAIDAAEVLLAGLEQLEYRGYDSAGLVLVGDDGSLWRARAAERARSLERLATAIPEAPASPSTGIGHTRWATHGAPSIANAHPHLDCGGRLALVHNGIIENHRELMAGLVERGHVFSSETDSEVLVHLVEERLDAGEALSSALLACIGALRGDFAVALVSAAEPDVLVGARRTSPLIFGNGAGTGVISSDIAAALATTAQLYALGDDEVLELRPDGFKVLALDGTIVEPAPLDVRFGPEAAKKGGYDDFMSKEMAEQPLAVADTLLGRVDLATGATDFEELTVSAAELAGFERVCFVACGSSYHASLVARQAVEAWARLPAEAEVASEFRYRDSVLDERVLVVAVSQSGESADTLHALREARRRGAMSIAVTNVVDSLMAREADGVLYTRAGPEIGVASTKCHLAQLAILEAFALHLARARGTIAPGEAAAIGADLMGLPAAVEAALKRVDQVKEVAGRLFSCEDFYFLGRRGGLPLAMEGALKLKELAYVRAEAYPAGEMKHGPIALIEPGSVVVAIATRTPLWEKVAANIAEMRARGATIVALCDEGDEETASHADEVLEVPALPELLAPIAAAVPLQRLAYEIARARGHDVDRPRNLAKVVTVE